MAPTRTPLEAYLHLLRCSTLLDGAVIDQAFTDFRLQAESPAATKVDPVDLPNAFGQFLIGRNLLTPWQHARLIEGKSKGYILGNYKLLALLGTGGMSQVFLAEHTKLKRLVAIKMLPVERVKDGSYLQRFLAEARAIANLDHPNIIRAYNVDNIGDLYFLAMEYIEGRDLEQLIQRGGALAPERAADLIAQAATGLDHAHKKNLVHRDIKPANLLIDPNDQVRLLDLGLVMLSGHTGKSVTVEHNDKVLGTADYLAPEQALDSHKVDHRVDIYALGCTLYYALAGEAPYPTGSVAQRMMKHLTAPVPDVRLKRPETPAAIAELAMAMMAKQKEDRVQTAHEVARLLRLWKHNPTANLAKLQELLGEQTDGSGIQLGRETPGSGIRLRPSASGSKLSQLVTSAPPLPLTASETLVAEDTTMELMAEEHAEGSVTPPPVAAAPAPSTVRAAARAVPQPTRKSSQDTLLDLPIWTWAAVVAVPLVMGAGLAWSVGMFSSTPAEVALTTEPTKPTRKLVDETAVWTAQKPEVKETGLVWPAPATSLTNTGSSSSNSVKTGSPYWLNSSLKARIESPQNNALWGSTSGGPHATGPLFRCVDDNPRFLTLLKEGPGQGDLEEGTRWAGRFSLKILNGHIYSTQLPGMRLKIVENPQAPDEFRWLTFAWRKPNGLSYVVLRLALNGEFNENATRRYYGGNYPTNQKYSDKISRQLSKTPPKDWEVHTRDMWADFGSTAPITGLIFSAGPQDQKEVAYFDHILFAKNRDDLDLNEKLRMPGAANFIVQCGTDKNTEPYLMPPGYLYQLQQGHSGTNGETRGFRKACWLDDQQLKVRVTVPAGVRGSLYLLAYDPSGSRQQQVLLDGREVGTLAHADHGQVLQIPLDSAATAKGQLDLTLVKQAGPGALLSLLCFIPQP